VRILISAAGAVFAGVLFVGPLLAGPERITWPEGFQTNYVLYNMVYNAQNDRLRMLYVNPEAHAAARAGQPAPNGTILVMADVAARLDANGNPALDAKGRYIPEGEILGNVFVMEKREGWGATLGIDVIPNGDWDYATFEPNGTRRDTSTTGCFACHAPRAERDFTFTYFVNVQERGP
jgi:hemoglobin